ncbi:acyltransferase family protein [Nocardioides sp. Bht2]|uniref:acyltransferase family protein n=1 Tax=Nocardioides sp. Bht2 TaxID=3392297 RepID=UPI0039B38D5B
MSQPHIPALDGLRTVAVYLVLVFHAGVATFDGGFVGVDLFFVLSGFLVTGLILAEVEERGGLRLGHFYARRVRRLLPAALVVIVATSAIFMMVASSVQRVPWTGDAQSALLYVANWRFIGQEGDYFGADVDKSPFLHFWSLAIEEQFYLVFPLVVIVLVWLRKRWRPALAVGLAVLFLASFAAQLYWAQNDTSHAYYGTDARLYQLLAGSLAALSLRAVRSRRDADAPSRLRPGVGWVFLAILLVAATDLVDFTPSTRGILATLATTGLVLTLAEQKDQSLAWFLGRPTVVYLGRISYGTYLWHWPVILLIPYFLDLPAWGLALVTFAVASGLAALSFEIFEHPLRTGRWVRRFGWRTVVVGVGASVLLAVTAVPPMLGSDRSPAVASSERPSLALPTAGDEPIPPGLDWAAYTRETGPANAYCTVQETDSCTAYEAPSGPRVLIAGDSHSLMLTPALTQLAKKHGFSLYRSSVGGCSWQRGVTKPVHTAAKRENCATARDALYGGLIDALDIDTVLLTQLPRGNDLADMTDAELVGDALIERSVRDSLDYFVSEGVKVVVLASALTPKNALGDPLECLATSKLISQCRVPAPTSPPLIDSFYRTADVRSDAVDVVDINPVMCTHWPICDAIDADGDPVWRDGLHFLPSTLTKHSTEIWELLQETGAFTEG